MTFALFRSRPVWVTIVFIAGWVVWHAWAQSAGMSKLATLLLSDYDAQRMHIAIHLRFTPEQFHMTALQRVGRILKVDGSRVILANVSEENLRDLAGNFWVEAIESSNE